MEANEALLSIKQNQENFGKTVVVSYAGPIVMLWGLMAFCGYMGAHFFPAYEPWIWLAVAIIGYSGTFLTIYRSRHKVRIRNEASKRHLNKISLIWISIVGYGILCMNILAPPTGFYTPAQIKTHTAIIPMLCWFLIGVLDEDKWSTGASLTIMALILAGFYLFSGDINLWLAFAVAVPIFLAGLRPYLKWR